MRPRMGGSGARAPRARTARHAQLTCHDLIDVAREHIAFEIDAVAGPAVAERRHGERVRDHGDRERPCRALEHGETDAVDRDRALFDEVASERRRDAEAEERAVAFTRDRAQLADAVDVTEDEMAAFVESFTRTGFTGGINWYRNFTRNWERSAGIEQKVKVPSLMVMAEKDAVLPPSAADGMDAYVTDLEKALVKDSGHWTQQEKPDDVNRIVLNWLAKRFPK